MRTSAIVLALLAACFGMPRGRDPLASPRNSEEYKAACEDGRAEADQELKDQTPPIDSCGTPASLFENLDRETGLPHRGSGCVVNAEIEGRVDRHSDRIKESAKANGLPKGSSKPWEKELFGLRDYVASRRKPDKPEILKAGGPARKSPDGSCSIRPVVEETDRRDRVIKSLAIEVDGDGRPPRRVGLFARADGSGLRIRSDGELSGEDVLPGFCGPVDSPFPAARPAEAGEAAPTTAAS